MRERRDSSSGGSGGGGRLHWTEVLFCQIAIGTSELSHKNHRLNVNEKEGGAMVKNRSNAKGFRDSILDNGGDTILTVLPRKK